MNKKKINKEKPLVSIIMGSSSDYKMMEEAILFFEDFKIPFEVQVVSAHRTPEKMQLYALRAQKRGIQVIIAGAGGSAHLPGMVASLTYLPVIGVPIEIEKGGLKGIDALLSIIQMPKGVPVATVAIDCSFNAALLAGKILALSNKGVQEKLKKFRQKQKNKVSEMNKNLKKREENRQK